MVLFELKKKIFLKNLRLSKTSAPLSKSEGNGEDMAKQSYGFNQQALVDKLEHT